MIWCCPLCQEPLIASEGGTACTASHRFDRAKQGYLHLLPAHHKRTQAPGDDRQMLQQRREFLQAGGYQPLVGLLQRHWREYLASHAAAAETASFAATAPAVTLLDSGCGEGYYLEQLQRVAEEFPGRVSLQGIDISKEAARLTARQLPGVEVAVASAFQLPVQTQSVNVLLRIFSPGDSAEVARVLKPQGEFWRVVPGPEHLLELKQSLYREVRPHTLPADPEGFAALEQASVRFTLALDSHDRVRQLLEMTPFVWRGSSDGKERLYACERLSVTADFVLQKYRLASTL